MKKIRFLFLCFFILSCTFSPAELEIRRGEKKEKEKDYQQAALHYERALKRIDSKEDLALYAAKKLANISLLHLDDLDKSEYALRYIILKSKKLEDKKSALESLAKMEYEKKQNYEKAIEEFQRVLSIEEREKKRVEIRFFIARSYFYMNRFYQAEEELDQILNTKQSKDTKEYHYSASVMKANIYHAKKEYQRAVDLYLKIINDFPKMSLKQKVWLNLSICYEDMKEFNSAIDLLSDIKNKVEESDFVEQKISRLKDRMQLEPGAKGLRK